MWATIIKVLLPVIAYLIEFFLRKNASNEAGKRAYIAFLESMSERGVSFAQRRLEARNQVDAVNDLWKKEKESAPPPAVL
jgi:hypothetical protein